MRNSSQRIRSESGTDISVADLFLALRAILDANDEFVAATANAGLEPDPVTIACRQAKRLLAGEEVHMNASGGSIPTLGRSEKVDGLSPKAVPLAPDPAWESMSDLPDDIMGDILLWNPCDGLHLVWATREGPGYRIREKYPFHTHWRPAPETPTPSLSGRAR